MAAATTVTATPTQQKQTGFQKFLNIAKIIFFVIVVLVVVAAIFAFCFAYIKGGGGAF